MTDKIQQYFDLHGEIGQKFLSATTIETAFSQLTMDVDIDWSNHQAALTVGMQLAYWSVLSGGGPFGAVIVKDGEWVSYGANHVVKHNDPTDHGEVNAIRRAIEASTASKLRGATLLSSTDPCPMCCGLAIELGIDRIVYCNTEHDAEVHGGFKDHIFWEDVGSVQKAEEKTPDWFDIDGNTMVVNESNGRSLIVVLREYCQWHGFEPSGLTFDACGRAIVLSLYEYSALRWAGVHVPEVVKILRFERPMMQKDEQHVGVGQQIFALYQQMGDSYGQISS